MTPWTIADPDSEADAGDDSLAYDDGANLVDASTFIDDECFDALDEWYANFRADTSGVVSPPVMLWAAPGDGYGVTIFHNDMRYRLAVDRSIHPGLGRLH